MTQSTELLPTQAAKDLARAFFVSKGAAFPALAAQDNPDLVEAFAFAIEHTTPDRNAVLRLAANFCAMLEAHCDNIGEPLDPEDQALVNEWKADLVALTTTPEPTDPAGVSGVAGLEDKIVCAFSDKAILQLDIHEDDPRLSQICDEVREETVRPILAALRPSPVLEVAKAELIEAADDFVDFIDAHVPMLRENPLTEALRAPLQAIKEGEAR